MRLEEYRKYDATALAELVRKGQVSPVELLESSMAMVERENGALNAVANRLYDQARERIRSGLPAGPFTGVPFMLKDLLAAYAGAPLTSGSQFCRNYVAKEHSELVSRFLAAGLVVLAQARSAEFGLFPVTESPSGPTRNPWCPERTAGGSSGGSGAAVAAGMVPMASGGDGGGSIRIPASCCGLFGLKPTRGRTPSAPSVENWQGFAQEHVLTRSVRDSAAVLDLSNTPELVSPYVTLPPSRPFSLLLEDRPRKLRIAYSTAPVLGTRTHADCVRAVEVTVGLLRELGHELTEAHFSIDRHAFIESWLMLMAGQVAADVRHMARELKRKPERGDFGRKAYLAYLLGEALSAASYVEAVRSLQQVGRAFGLFLTNYDAWLTPTLGELPVPHGAFEARSLAGLLEKFAASVGSGRLVLKSGKIVESAAPMFEFVSYTPLANVGGQPSMSVPLFWNAANIPVGVMFTGRFGEDAALLALARELERARPWCDRQPAAQ